MDSTKKSSQLIIFGFIFLIFAFFLISNSNSKNWKLDQLVDTSVIWAETKMDSPNEKHTLAIYLYRNNLIVTPIFIPYDITLEQMLKYNDLSIFDPPNIIGKRKFIQGQLDGYLRNKKSLASMVKNELTINNKTIVFDGPVIEPTDYRFNIIVGGLLSGYDVVAKNVAKGNNQGVGITKINSSGFKDCYRECFASLVPDVDKIIENYKQMFYEWQRNNY